MHAFSDTEAWVGDGSGNVVKTTDGGETWTVAKAREGKSGAINTLKCTSASTCIMTQKNELLKTDDGGANWRVLYAIDDDTKSFADASLSGKVVIAVGHSNSVRCEEDTCTAIEWPNSQPRLHATYLVSETIGYITGANCRVSRTTDGGVTWQNFHDWGCGLGGMIGVFAQPGDCRAVVAAISGAVEVSTGCPPPPPPPRRARRHRRPPPARRRAPLSCA